MANVTNDLPPLERLASGIHGLDEVLSGGLLRGGVYTIAGPPGSGKTILGNQIAFRVAEQGERATFVSLLGETHGRMLVHLRGMRFFDPSAIGSRIHYFSGAAALEQGGLPALAEMLRKLLRAHRPKLLVVDRFEIAAPEYEAGRDAQRFARELSASAGLLGVTVLLLRLDVDDERFRRTEAPIVDGILELSQRLAGPRAVRELVVRKFRGSPHLLGRHAFEIGEEGIAIYPRMEARLPQRLPANDGAARTGRRAPEPFGLAGLDALLGGGLPSGALAALVGAPGTGKTVLGLRFLAEGARRGQPGLFFGFHEEPGALLASAKALGLGLEAPVQTGLIALAWQPPAERNLDALAEELVARLRALPQADDGPRLFIDGLGGFRRTLVPCERERMTRFFAALARALRAEGATTLVSDGLPLGGRGGRDGLLDPAVADSLDAVLLLRSFEDGARERRVVSVVKVRGSASGGSRELAIGDRRVTVARSASSTARLLGLPGRRPRPARAQRKAAPKPRRGRPGAP